MLRARVIESTPGEDRVAECIAVAPGELKVSCGEHVVFETAPLVGAAAIAVWDPVTHVGGVVASKSVGPDSDGSGSEFDVRSALKLLIESVLNLGGRRDRLSFSAAGNFAGLSVLGLTSHVLDASAPSRHPRRGTPEPSILVLELGPGRASVQRVV